MKKLLCLSLVFIYLGCASSSPTTQTKSSNKNTDERYGYSESNPIKVGGVTDGPSREREYLYSLSGPNGEAVWFQRQGSCCQFKTDNSPFGEHGLLDMYSVTYEGKGDTVTLFLNMYDEDVLYAPDDFKFRF